ARYLIVFTSYAPAGSSCRALRGKHGRRTLRLDKNYLRFGRGRRFDTDQVNASNGLGKRCCSRYLNGLSGAMAKASLATQILARLAGSVRPLEWHKTIHCAGIRAPRSEPSAIGQG